MSSVSTKIVFPAILEIDQFASQIVRLGGVFPEIEIEQVDSSTGLHHFKISKVLPHYGENVIASAVTESELQIDHFWNILAYIRNATIRPTGQVFYEVNERLQEFNPPRTRSSAKAIGVASEHWFDDKIALFQKPYDFDLLKRYNYCRIIEEPIGRFISLYSLLASCCDDNQRKADGVIEEIDPNIARFVSPKDGKPETIFTKLRNELAHNRTGTSIVETHRNIELHLSRFEWIVQTIVARSIEIV